MNTIDHFNLRSFDLNLLVAFDALMQDRSVTRAAARLKIQQPAMSHNLATLRVLFNDELLVRVGHEMRPTSKAELLRERVRQALAQAQDAVLSQQIFTPSTEIRTFRLGFSSEMELLCLPSLATCLAQQAPGVHLLSRSFASSSVYNMLDNGDIDVALGCFDSGLVPSRFLSKSLFEQRLVCCFNPLLIDLSDPVTFEEYQRAKHVVLSQNDSLRGCLDNALENLQVELDVVLASPEWAVLLAAAASGPFIATLPARLAQKYGSRFGLITRELPLFSHLRFSVSMIWTAQSGRELGAAWLRERIERTLFESDDVGHATAPSD